MAEDDAQLAGAGQFAAVTKSSVRNDKKRPRTTARAITVQPISEMMIVMKKYIRVTGQVGGTAAASPIQSGMVGIERTISIKR